MDNSGDGHVLYGWSYSKSDRLLRRKGWWHLCETRLGWDNRHQLSPHPELVTSHPDAGDMLTDVTMTQCCSGWGWAPRVTRHLLSNYSLSGFSEIIDQDVSDRAPANKATVGQPWLGCSQGQALNGYNSMFYDPPPARLPRAEQPSWVHHTPRNVSKPRRNYKSCQDRETLHRHELCSGNRLGWGMMGSLCQAAIPALSIRTCLRILVHSPDSIIDSSDDIWASWEGSALLI